MNNTVIPSSSSSHEESDQDENPASATIQSQLATKVLEKFNSNDLLSTPIQFLNVNWDKIKFRDMTTEEMKSIWKRILSKVCLYRTVADVVSSFRENPYRVVTEEVEEWNSKLLDNVKNTDTPVKVKVKKIKEKSKYGFAMKPLTSYQLFCKDAIQKDKMSLKDAATKWAHTTEKERAFFTEKAQKEYKEKMESYMIEHPEDEVAQTFLKLADVRAQKALLQGQKDNKRKNSAGKEDETSNPKSPKSPKTPKKKKMRKEKTGFSFFVEKKEEELKLENPDWDEESIMAKLEKKYNKLSDERRAKYEKRAKEENTESS